ncbi:uncharacterized protein LOC114337190 [Diabrotica virgifera virgifera]|uniref:Uncharacterized protein LOC114337190 n=1 Tax=Diabrotica virgifera virgifera TaxID=50390 RepID=A0A6P7G3A3_DIAVI|nr:uncharacterized protein LOC114337190 [Diabrotica virgifera virgifera]XP_050513629.1 uncharacterized protein LOC114337190 [Diabrotica virgifera virgifera]
MELSLILGIVSIILPHFTSAASNFSTEQINSIEDTTQTPLKAYLTNGEIILLPKSEFPPKNEILLYKVVRKLRDLWNNGDENTVTGRCIQLAKRIRALIPAAVFAMGVIVTLLGFLTMFSLKSIGMLALLLLINVSGAVAKTTAFLAYKGKEHHRPSTVHFHVHKDDDFHGGYPHIGHSSPDVDWDRKSRINQELMELDRLESYNLYNKLLKDLALKNYKI